MMILVMAANIKRAVEGHLNGLTPTPDTLSRTHTLLGLDSTLTCDFELGFIKSILHFQRGIASC